MEAETGTDRTARGLSLRRFLLANAGLLLLLLGSLVLGALLGPGGFRLGALLPLDPDTNQAAAALLLERLPRALMAGLVGMALSCTGAACQALLRNPLADPFIMGVSGGAALGGTVALVLGGTGLAFGLSFEAPAAFLGALLATVLVYRVGRVAGRVDTTTILLVGVVFNAFASAIIMFLRTLRSPAQTQEIQMWLMGGLGYPRYETLAALGAAILPALLGLCAFGRALNALSLGDQGASHLGVDVERTKRWVFALSSLLVGLAVSVSGMIGFVGLIVPHLCRLWLGPDHRLLLPASALAGASFLVLADLAARLLFLPLGTEPPVGVVTAFLGGPFFLLLLRRRAGVAFLA